MTYLKLNSIGLSTNINTIRHNANFTEQGEFVIGQQSVLFIQQKISANKLFKAPVFALYESVRSLAFHSFSFFPFGIQDGKFEFGSNLCKTMCLLCKIKEELVLIQYTNLAIFNSEFVTNLAFIAGNKQKVQGKVVFALFVQTFGVHSQTPFQLIVLPS